MTDALRDQIAQAIEANRTVLDAAHVFRDATDAELADAVMAVVGPVAKERDDANEAYQAEAGELEAANRLLAAARMEQHQERESRISWAEEAAEMTKQRNAALAGRDEAMRALREITDRIDTLNSQAGPVPALDRDALAKIVDDEINTVIAYNQMTDDEEDLRSDGEIAADALLAAGMVRGQPAGGMPCRTPGADFHIEVTPDHIGVRVDFPKPIGLTDEQAEKLDGDLHNFVETLLARYWPVDDAEDCGACIRCLEPTWPTLAGIPMRRMVICATCGNKRCPHATDHRHACTGSNEPGQPGSDYVRSEVDRG